jgi:hypothetical protein
MTAGAKVYYWDDVEFGGGGSTLDQIDLPVTFEDTATVDYTLTDFGDNTSMLGADPAGGTNWVAITTKPTIAAAWAGTTIGTPAGFANPIPFVPGSTKMSVRVYSPDAGIPIRLKVEDAADPTKSVETEAVTTMANAWETLTFDFSNPAMGTAAINFSYVYDKASIFFNFGTDGMTAGAKVYYWDDVMFGAPATGLSDLKELGLTFYPNPVRDNLLVRLDQRMDEVVVLNQLGQQLQIIPVGKNEVRIDFSMLSPGLYMVMVKAADATTGTFKVLKY